MGKVKIVIDRLLYTVMLVVIFVMLAFLATLFLSLIIIGLCWLVGWNVIESNNGLTNIIGASFFAALILLNYLYVTRYNLSQNIIRREDMFVWHIAYGITVVPVAIVMLLVVAVYIISEIKYMRDDKIESLSELVERTDELGSVYIDTAAFNRDLEGRQKDDELNWKEVVDTDCGFSIRFPNMPIIKASNKKESIGVQMPITYYADFTDKLNVNQGYWITCHIVPDGTSTSEMFEKVKSNLVKDDQVISETDVQTSGYIAKDLKVKYDSYSLMNIRIAYYKSNLYSIRVLSPIDDADNKSVRFFFDSFEPR